MNSNDYLLDLCKESAVLLSVLKSKVICGVELPMDIKNCLADRVDDYLYTLLYLFEKNKRKDLSELKCLVI